MDKQKIIEKIKADRSAFQNLPEEVRADKEIVTCRRFMCNLV